MALKTIKSDPIQPVKMMVYGQEGVGKSTLGAKSDKPIFISPEGGYNQLTDSKGNPIDVYPNVNSWEKLLAAINEVFHEEHEFKTLVLDSADWIESLAHRKIVGPSDEDIVRANGGYGSGLRESQKMHFSLLNGLSEIVNKKRMNVIVIAHAHVKQVKDPHAQHDYDGYEPKMHEYVSSQWREWVDILAFTKFVTETKMDRQNKKAKAFSDDSRKIYFVKDAAFQAKNRYGLPAEMDFTFDTYKDIMKYVQKNQSNESAKELFAECKKLLKEIPDSERKEKATKFTDEFKGNAEKLKSIRDQLIVLKGETNANV